MFNLGQSAPQLLTEIPGPASEWLAERMLAVECPAFEARRDLREGESGTSQTPVVYGDGLGSNVTDADGNVSKVTEVLFRPSLNFSEGSLGWVALRIVPHERGGGVIVFFAKVAECNKGILHKTAREAGGKSGVSRRGKGIFGSVMRGGLLMRSVRLGKVCWSLGGRKGKIRKAKKVLSLINCGPAPSGLDKKPSHSQSDALGYHRAPLWGWGGGLG